MDFQNKLNKRFKMNPNPNSDLLREFKVVKYQPDDIILLHRSSKKPYQFYDQSVSQNTPPGVQPNLAKTISNSSQPLYSPILIRPTILAKGLLYPRPHRTLAVELSARRRAHSRTSYTQQELLNTFKPVLECLNDLHSKGIVHGQLSKDHIIFTEKGEIKVRDWMVESKNKKISYYTSPALQKKESNNQEQHQNQPKASDLRAIGLMIAQAASLRKMQFIVENPIQQVLEVCVEEVSKDLIIFIVCLVKQLGVAEEMVAKFVYQDALSCPPSDQKHVLEDTYDKICKLHQTRRTAKSATHGILSPGQISPTKKFNITSSTKKTIRVQETENRRTPVLTNEDVKKKHIEKITKIIERSNAFVNQLMTRRASDANKKPGHQHTNSKHNVSSIGNQNTNSTGGSLTATGNNGANINLASGIKRTSKELSISKTGSPAKRLRVIQKKK